MVSRLYLQAGCLLLALLAASALAAPAPIKGAVKGANQYEEGDEYYKYDEDNYYYRSHGDDESYHSAPETSTIHLQEVARRSEEDGTQT